MILFNYHLHSAHFIILSLYCKLNSRYRDHFDRNILIFILYILINILLITFLNLENHEPSSVLPNCAAHKQQP